MVSSVQVSIAKLVVSAQHTGEHAVVVYLDYLNNPLILSVSTSQATVGFCPATVQIGLFLFQHRQSLSKSQQSRVFVCFGGVCGMDI